MSSVDIEGQRKVKNRGYEPAVEVEEDNELQWTAWLIPMFVVANVAMFIVAMYLNNCPARSDLRHGHSHNCVATFLGRFSFQPLRENPLFGPSSSTLRRLGALEHSRLVEMHQGWRLVTCIWLHAGVVHLLTNMLSLVFIGVRLEQQFGFVRICLIYLLSGFGGSVLSSLFIQSNISVGASGSLFGLLGAMLSELITNWSIYANKAAAMLTLLFIIVINLGIGLLPHVDNFSHVGGFGTGFLLGFILLPRPQFAWMQRGTFSSHTPRWSKYKSYQYILWLMALVMLVVGMGLGLVMLLRGENGNAYCSWCHYLSCFPTSNWNCNA